MKIDRIAFTKTFPVGMTWEKVHMEAEIDGMDNRHVCLAILKEEVEHFHKTSNPQLYPNGKEATIIRYGDRSIGQGDVGIIPTNEKTINRQDEREYIKVEKEIATVTSLEELSKYKEYCGKNPDLMTAYTNKLRELTNKIKV